jgi:hypothetical protein
VYIAAGRIPPPSTRLRVILRIVLQAFRVVLQTIVIGLIHFELPFIGVFRRSSDARPSLGLQA